MCCIQWNTDCEVCTNGDMEAEWFMICSESRVRPCVSALIRSELLASSAEWSWSPRHALVTLHRDIQEKTDPEVKFVWRHILLNLLFVVVLSWVKKFSLTPGTGFLFHGIDMKSEASGIPISHNNNTAAKPSHEVLSPNRNNPRPFILIRPVVAQPSCRQSGNIVQWPVASWQLYSNVQVWVTQLSWLPDIATNLMMDGFYQGRKLFINLPESWTFNFIKFNEL